MIGTHCIKPAKGDYTQAFRKYVVMAEQGYEVAQHNAAYLLEHQLGMSPAVALGDQTIRMYKAAAGQVHCYISSHWREHR